MRRWLPASFPELDFSEQRRWLLLLTLSGTLFFLTVVGMGMGIAAGQLNASTAPTGILSALGYGLSFALPYRSRSHELGSHVFLGTMLTSLVVIIIQMQQPWLFAPIVGTVVPILAVQFLPRRAALAWTLVAAGILAVTIVVALTGTWFNEPETMLGSDAFDHAFVAASLPIMVIVLVWFHEQSRVRVEMASSFKNAVLASMSHELRTPLNGVLGMLSEALEDSSGSEQRERLVDAHRAGSSLLDIVDDALDLLQAESGGLSLAHEPFDLRQGLGASIERIRDASGKTSVAISLHYPEDEPRWFIGDGRKVLRVVDKLVDNGLKFTDRGHVKVLVEVSDPSGEDAEPMLSIRVEDTGIGIPADKHAVIFDKLTQLEDSWDRTRGGTGMGLAICRTLVDLMGGAIGIRSEAGKGTTMTLSIPMATMPAPMPEPVTAEPSVPASTRAGSNIRILVVEDNVINQKVAQRMLERLGCEVEVVDDGEQAVTRVRQAEFDLVFMDVQMPVMDGFEATAAIRDASDEDVARLPVVAMTAFTMAGDRERCLAAGMSGYVGKPIDKERLASELRRFTPWVGPSSAA